MLKLHEYRILAHSIAIHRQPEVEQSIPTTRLTSIIGEVVSRTGQLDLHITIQPPSLCPPAAVVVLVAVLQISSKAGLRSSPVAAEHSTYRSALMVCAS